MCLASLRVGYKLAFRQDILGRMNDKERPVRAWGLALALLCVAPGLWFWLRAAPPPQPAPAAPVARVVAARALARPSPSPRAAAPAAPTPSKSSIEVCGYGHLAIDASDPMAAHTVVRKLTDAARNKWLSSLQDSADLRARAAGLILNEAYQSFDGDHAAPTYATPALVQLAVGARDPAVYALAFADCRRHPDPDGACNSVSASGWADRDPDNGLPWLFLADQAHKAGDPVAEAAAVVRAAGANRFDAYTDSLFAFAAAELPSDVTPLARWVFTVEASDIEAALPAPVLTGSRNYCSADALADPQVASQCNAMAELYVAKATTIRDFTVGIDLGQRLGWPESRLSALHREKKALLQSLADLLQDFREPWGCRSVQAGNAMMHERMQSGEMAMARVAIERSGESIDTLSERYDAQIERSMQNARARQDTQRESQSP